MNWESTNMIWKDYFCGVSFAFTIVCVIILVLNILNIVCGMIICPYDIIEKYAETDKGGYN